MIRVLLCLWLPWHRMTVERVLTDWSRKLRCSCGRAYAMNDDVRAIIPWDSSVEALYRRIGESR